MQVEAYFTTPPVIIDKAARAEKRAKDPHYIALQKAEHIIEWIEGKVRKYAWGLDKKQGIYRYYSKKEFKELAEAGTLKTDF